MWAQASFVLSQSTGLTDGRTDGQRSGSCVIRLCISAARKNMPNSPGAEIVTVGGVHIVVVLLVFSVVILKIILGCCTRICK